MLKETDFNHLSTYFLAKEAEKRGAKVEKLFPGTKQSFLRVEYNGKVDIIIGQRISTLSYNAFRICVEKQLTKLFLKQNGIKTAEGRVFNNQEIKKALDFIEKIGFPIVVKETDGIWGRNVFVNIKDESKAKDCIEKILETKSNFLIEKFHEGTEYRVLATKNKLLGVINRVPANVIGDGKKTIKELINIKNSDPRRGEKHEKSLVKIKVDSEILDKLSQNKLNLGSVPKKDEQIFLRNNSNISTGGDSIDVTDFVHPKLKEIAQKVIRSIPGLPYGGFDLLIDDITKDPEETNYIVIEINDSPMISMHHIPFKGEGRNVAKEIIDLAFNN